MRRGITCAGVAVVALAALTVAASAQPYSTYPTKTVRVIVPTAAGGNPDFVARPVLQKMSESLKHTFFIDNRPGAAGIIGVELAIRAAPDGYTLLFAARGHIATPPALHEKLPYDATRDLAPISRLVDAPLALFVNPSLPARSVRELVTLARARPRELTYASFGVGSSTHFTTEAFSAATGIRLVHVPYKGSAPAATALLAGEVMLGFDALQATLQHVRTRRLRALAIGADRRIAVAPDLPTFAEAGTLGFTDVAWYGLFAPAQVPHEVIAKLHAEAIKALAAPDIREHFERAGMLLVGNTPAQFTQQVRNYIARYAKIAREAGIRAE